MSDQWLSGNLFLHDGVILQADEGEWGMVDAINRYEAEQHEKAKRMLKRISTRERKGEWILVKVKENIPGSPILEKQCSSCGYVHSLQIPDDYCPKCGSHNSGNYNPSIEEFLNGYRCGQGSERGQA